MLRPPQWENSTWVWLKSRGNEIGGGPWGFKHWWEMKKLPSYSVSMWSQASVYLEIYGSLCGLAWDSLLHDVNPSQFPDKTGAKKWRLWPQFLLLVSRDSLTLILHPIPQHSHPYPLEKEPNEWPCHHHQLPSHSQKLLFWAIIHRLCSAAGACEHLPGGKIPGARSPRERATTCMFCCIWLISKKKWQFFICSWTALQYPAISLKWIHSTQKDGMRVTLIWGCRKTSKTIDWTGRELWDHPVRMLCATDEKTGSRRGHGLPTCHRVSP